MDSTGEKYNHDSSDKTANEFDHQPQVYSKVESENNYPGVSEDRPIPTEVPVSYSQGYSQGGHYIISPAEINQGNLISNKKDHFHEALFGCFSDVKSCLVASLLPGGLCCIQATAVNSVTKSGEFTAYMLVFCFGCVGGAINRKRLREVSRIKGSFSDDCLTWCYCGPCAACQEFREAKQEVGVISLVPAFIICFQCCPVDECLCVPLKIACRCLFR